MKKHFGELLDEFVTTQIKVFMLIDKIQRNEHTKEDSYKCQQLNKYRSELKNAINEYFKERQEVKL